MKKLFIVSLLSMFIAVALYAKDSKPLKQTKIEKAQARIVKIQAESDCLLKLVEDPNITKADLAEIWLNDGTCIKYIKRINKVK